MAVAVPGAPFDLTELIAQYSDCSFDEQCDAYLQVELVERAAFLTKVSLAVSIEASSSTREARAFLSLQAGVQGRRCSEMLTVGAALQSLPHLCAAYLSGSLSWNQISVLSEFVTPDLDEHWAAEACDHSLAALRSFADANKLEEPSSRQSFHDRSLKWRRRDAHGYDLFGFLPNDMAEVLFKRVETIIDSQPLDGPDDLNSGRWRQRAGLLNSLCKSG